MFKEIITIWPYLAQNLSPEKKNLILLNLDPLAMQ